MSRPETLSSELSPAARALAPYLFLISNCDRPTDNSQRLSLHGIERLSIRRRDAEQASGSRILVDGVGIEIQIADAWMSTTHATLHRILGAWSLEDNGSKNGTLLNGRAIRREMLADGDLIETGHTFFLFRESLPSAETAPVVDAGSLRPAAPGLATLLPSLEATFRHMEAFSKSSIPVLILGESGTGKEGVAAALHALSGRLGPFQPVNCGALSLPLMQAELFGHAQESGAGHDSLGLIRAAEGGTLFLDEIGDLTLPAQSLLLRVLQDGEVFPLGASRPIRVHVRVVAATNHNLEVLAAEDRFRTDLLARMAGLTLTLPALRDRREDLGMLIGNFLHQQAAGVPASFTSEALRAMLLYRWPLNIRELEKTVQASTLLARHRPVSLEDLPPAVRASLEPKPLEKQGGRHADGARSAPGPNARLQRFVDELSRRHVVRVMVAYSVAVFGGLQGADIIVTRLSLPPQWMVWLVIASLVGLPVTAVLSWIYDWTPTGIARTAPLSANHRSPPRVRRRQTRTLVIGLILFVTLATGAVMWWHNRWPR